MISLTFPGCGPDINHEQIYNVLRYGTMVKQHSEWLDTQCKYILINQKKYIYFVP